MTSNLRGILRAQKTSLAWDRAESLTDSAEFDNQFDSRHAKAGYDSPS